MSDAAQSAGNPIPKTETPAAEPTLPPSGHLIRVGKSLENYDSARLPDSSPAEVDESTGNITYKRVEGAELVQYLCTPSGCMTSGVIQSCGNNQVATLNGGCACTEGYQIVATGSMGGTTILCEPSCPTGTTSTHESDIGTRCQCNANPDVFIPVGTNDTSACISDDRDNHGCGEDPRIADGDYANPISVQHYETCIAQARQAIIDRMKASNQTQAEAAAQAAAEANWEEAASNAAATLSQGCTAAVNQVMSGECGSISVSEQLNVNANTSGTQQACQSQIDYAKAEANNISQKVSSCRSQLEALRGSACPSSTDNVSAEGAGSSSQGVGDVVMGSAVTEAEVGASATASRSGTRPVDTSAINSATASLYSSSANIAKALDHLNSESEKCVQAFQQDQDNATYTPTSVAGMGNTFNNSLAGSRGNFKAGLGELGRGIGQVANAFNKYNKNYGSDRKSASFGDSNKVRPSVGASDTYDNPYMGDTESTNSESNGDSSLAAMSGNGGSYGRGSRGSAPSGLSGANNAAPKKRKAFKSAKSRNRILGYKKVKGSSGSASFAIKPSDYRRLGKAQIQKALADARKKFGKDKPLKFDGKKFVLDFLAMKESERFKRSQNQAQRFWAGTSRSEQPKLYVHENPNLNIFKLLSFRYGRQTLKEDPVKRSTASSVR